MFVNLSLQNYNLGWIVLIAAAFAIGTEGSLAPSLATAPLIAPAAIGYTQAIPQNIPPFASQFSVINRALSPLVAAPAVTPLAYAAPVVAPFAAPLAGPLATSVTARFSAPLAARIAAPLAAPLPAPLAAPVAPLRVGAAPVLPAAYTALPYSAPFLQPPHLAPAFVR
ncbi:hypothetical protein ACJJTC_014931 [Scirpophaga incertulas]